jgi:hypothetical protein
MQQPAIDPQAACVANAKRITQQGQAWVCLGDKLTYNAGTRRTPDWSTTAAPQTSAGPMPASRVGEDYDFWCESKSKCSRKISAYIAETKGNATYGVNDEVYGSMDIIWRQNFDGPWSRWRLTLKWESGSAVEDDGWIAWQREEEFGPDSNYCHSKTFHPSAISRVNRWAYSPSKTRMNYCDKKVGKKEDWHDDLKGWFFCRGERFAAGTLHTGRWESFRKSGGGYGQRYKSSWDY